MLLVDSYGLLALALDRRSAAAELGLTGGRGGHTGTPGLSRDPTSVGPEGWRSTVRQGTTIAIVALLVLIFAAAFAQFVLRLGP